MSDNGILTGATGVNVLGAYFDVVFKDGSCNSLFAGCNSSLFSFQDNYSAIAAPEALQAHVFVGVFNDDPRKTRGCESTPASCIITTPHYTEDAYTVFVERFINSGTNSLGTDFIGGASMTFDEDTSTAINNTYAIWSPSIVPVPGAVLLFGSALAGLSAATRRRKLD